ncbi:CHASE domain-containing protein [Oricola indica]|jgi:CHASE1-domain containing sensor protein|uniref:CHASE domain-containing protein n=1 Tax=Oricola indica TaxID=2872591 RepID=UPI001CBE7F00|nr:CHASE domain-containing protein [Oricola indica]
MKRFLPAIVFLVIAFLGAGITFIVYQAIRETAQAEFESSAQEAVDRVTSRVDQHLSLLAATHAFFAANSGTVLSPAFKSFVTGLDIEGTYAGVQGIGYAMRIPTGQEYRAETRLKSDYDIDRQVWPEATDQQYRTPIVLLEPQDSRNDRALGYDMYSEERRRAAMQASVERNAATASAPVELVQEITSVKQAGFLVYMPLFTAASTSGQDRVPAGFIYAPFRAGDLHVAALETPPRLPVVLKTFDVTDNNAVLLYASPNHDELRPEDAMETAVQAEIAGRTWRFEVSSVGGAAEYADFLPVYALCVVLVVLAGSLAAGARWQHKAVESAIALHETSRRNLEEKELLLQEMRHRIKNSISRVMAIARQTASSSDTIADFNKSFSARMNAMANAQDLLARSHWGRADMGDLLTKELEQVFGDQKDASHVEGPAINLNERAAQALGLVFHEMATNALKYSGVADGNAELKVNWTYEGKGSKRMLRLVWAELGNIVTGEPERKGFGTRLVEANVRGELGGEIERRFDEDGMTVTFRIPAKAVA